MRFSFINCNPTLSSINNNSRNIAILIAYLAIEGKRRKLKRRRSYLRRCDLIPNPRELIPWIQLYESGQDTAFILTLGFDVATFHFLLENGCENRWNNPPIPRNDVNPDGEVRAERRSLNAKGCLALVLHFLNSTISAHICETSS